VSLEELETTRKKVLLHSRGLLFLGWVFVLLGLRGGWWGLLLLVGLYLIGLTRLQIRTLQAKIKEALVAPLSEAMGFRYSPERGFPQEEILASGLFPPHDDYDSEDLVEGEVKGIPFVSSDIALYKKVEVKSDNVTTYQYRKFFGGTLYRFHLPFSVEGEVRFGPRGKGMVVASMRASHFEIIIIVFSFLLTNLLIFWGAWGAFTIWVALFWYALWGIFIYVFYITTRPERKKGLERVVLESPELERLFYVYGEDQVETRKVLTPRVQEALVRLRKYFGKPIWGAVRERYLWLAVEGRDRFSVPVNRPVMDILEMEKVRYQEELLEISRVVEVLGLEEEAKRRGAWRRRSFVDLNESSPTPKKDAVLDGGEPQQAEGAPTRKYKLFGR
jgi:hypothetical protein